MIAANYTLFTTAEAGDYLRLAEQTIRTYITRGLIRAEKHGRDNFISQRECDRYSREKKPPGNPNFVRKSRGKRRR